MKRLLSLMLLLSASAVQAQDQTLPDLAPREVEIRGELKIAFPKLERQPLLGFNPPPLIPELPANRHPFVEEYKQTAADLPPSPLQRPEPPEVSPLAGRTPINGEFEAGGGRYLSRFGRARIGVDVTERAVLLARLDYRGTDGDVVVVDNLGAGDIRNAFDSFEGAVGLQTYGPRVSGGLLLDGFRDAYTRFGTVFCGRECLHGNTALIGRGGQGTAWLRSRPGGRISYALEARYNRSRFAPEQTETALPETIREERRGTLKGALTAALSRGQFWTQLSASRAGLDEGDALGNTASWLDGGLGLRVSLPENITFAQPTTVRVGGRLFATTARQPNDETTRRVFGSLDLRLDVYPLPGLNLYLQNRPGITERTLADVYQINPYLFTEPEVMPETRLVDAELGTHYFYGPVQLAARVGYERLPDHLYFEELGEEANPAGLLARSGDLVAQYADVRVTRLGGEVSLVLPAGVQATTGLTYRDGQLADTNADIPHFAPLVAHGQLSWAFAHGKGLLQARTEYEGRRYLDLARTTRISPFFDLDVQAGYQLTEWIGVTARVENLSTHRERWRGYPLSPTVFMGGLRVRW